MRTTTLLFFLLACACGSLLGNTYTGTIVSTITFSTNPAYTVGETLPGWYSYESSTVDGVFYFPSGPETAGLTGNLQGGIGAPAIPELGEGADFWAVVPYITPAELDVEGGEVTGLYFGIEQWHTYYVIESVNGHSFFGGVAPLFGPSGFIWSCAGTLEFSRPEPTPDTGQTFWMLLGAVICLVVCLEAPALKVRGGFLRLDRAT